jgi:hypothetical protein
MPVITSQFESELHKRVNEYIAHVTDLLTTGTGVQNYEQYQFLVGQIFAMKRVTTEFFDDVHKVLNER